MPLTLKDPSLLRHQAFSGGEWVNAQSGQSFAVTNPATGEEIAKKGGGCPTCLTRPLGREA